MKMNKFFFKKRKQRKRPLREPGPESKVKEGAASREKSHERESEKMKGKGRKKTEKKMKADKRAKQERNLASNESIAVWQ